MTSFLENEFFANINADETTKLILSSLSFLYFPLVLFPFSHCSLATFMAQGA